MKNCKNVFLWSAVAVFLIFAVLYFVPFGGFVYKKTIPSFLLALTAWICVGFDRKSFPALMAFGFSFACFGDLMGDFREFIPQLLCFAVCHLFYIVYFAKVSVRGGSVVRYALVSLIPTAVVLLGLFTIVLKVASPMNLACAFYLIMISTMLYFAVLTRKWLYILGAVCFVVSDYILAYNKFVSPLPYERYLIMLPYYAAILLIFLGVGVEDKR